MSEWMNRDDLERLRYQETALAKMARLYPKVWRPQRWTYEAISLGVVMAFLGCMVWVAAAIIHYA